jgi:LysR family transcriptional regulator for metE and metH
LRSEAGTHRKPGAETRKPLPALLNNELEVAIVYQPTPDRRVKMTDLFDDELVAVTAAGHPLADREYLRPKDFSTENLFSYTSLATNFLYLKVLRPAGICPKEVSEIPLTEAMLELIKAGLGIAALARRAVQPYLARGEFRAIPITARGLFRKWYAATRNTRIQLDPLKSFIEALHHECK